RENLTLNPKITGVRFEVADLTTAVLPVADVVVANLTGTQLVRWAESLMNRVRRRGVLIVSGLLRPERQAVVAAYSGFELAETHKEDEWVCLRFCRKDSTS